MDAREIVYRVQEKLRSEAERFRYYAGVLPAPTDEVLDDFKSFLVEKAAPHFYFASTGDARSRRLNLIRDIFPDRVDRALKDAERILQHKVQFLGFDEVDLGATIDWHRDPLTRKSWPLRFWSGYDLIHDSAAGDPKVIHELNRHQHIVALAKAYFLTNDERYSQEAVSQINGWIDQNPPSAGINWQSSLEIAIRSISWLWTIFLLLPSEALTEADASRIGRSLFAQLDHIDRFPSLFSSPNTHLIGEATALFVAGTVFQGVEQAGHWQRKGADLLIQELERQVKVDGVHGELSSYYHCYTLDFLLQALTLSELNGFMFPDSMWKQLDKMMDFLVHFTRNNGTLPLVGDDDGGRALAIVSRDYRLCEFDEEMIWLIGKDVATPLPRETHKLYLDAGYVIQRSGWGPHESQVIFDCGGLGFLNGGHGHADALSLVLNVGATEMLTDPGTYVYNGSSEWRNFFRSSHAHNTVVVDGVDQSIPDGTFKWRSRAECPVVRHVSGERFDYVEAEHDGYRNAPHKIVHRRCLLHVSPGLWVAVDDFQGSTEGHTFDFYFHFPPNADLLVQTVTDSAVVAAARKDSARLDLFMCASAFLKTEIIEGQLDPIQGWVSALYGQKSPAPVLCIRMSAPAPASAMFILRPSHFGADTADSRNSGLDPGTKSDLRPLSVTGELAIACEAEHGDVKDIFVSSSLDRLVEIPEFSLRGRFFWLRLTSGRLSQVLGIDCKEIRYRDEILLRDESSRPHFEYVPVAGAFPLHTAVC